MEKLKIGIIGLGLIGGSIFKALKDKGYDICAVSKSQSGENISSDINILKDRNVIFVCSEMSKTLDTLEKLEGIAGENVIVADVCSIKGFLENKKYPFKFITSHPMAGTEFSGFENSFKELFIGAKWVLGEKNNVLENLIEEMGAKPVFANAKEHDITAALISHAPALLAYAIFDAAEDNKLALVLASSGFRDMTRLAMTPPKLICDMLKFNEENIDFALAKIINSLQQIKSLSYNQKIEVFEQIAKKRSEMYENGKNKISY
jgi:prephenate dehydrogenase